MQEKLKQIRNARHDYLYNVGEKLKEIGYILNVIELDKIESVTKAHIALDVISNKANEETLMKDFNHIPEKGEFIETIMNEGCKAFVKKTSITPQEAAELIRSAHGKVVLAHPVAYKYEDNLTQEQVIEIMDDIQPDGIEANYIYVDKNNNIINDIEIWKKVAKDKNLYITTGSDFHNFSEYHPVIGLNNENLDYENIEEFIKIVTNKKFDFHLHTNALLGS